MSVTDSRRMERLSRLAPLSAGDFLLIDSVFWHLPFVSSKQAHAVREKADLLVTEDEWTEKFNLFYAEYKLN